jgi:hypothetical protein
MPPKKTPMRVVALAYLNSRYLLFLAYSWVLVAPSKSLIRSVNKLWTWLNGPKRVPEKETGKMPADDEPELRTAGQRETV